MSSPRPFNVLRRLFVLAALGTSCLGFCDDWTETAYVVTSPPTPHTQDANSFSVANSIVYNWYSSATSHFTVTGATTQNPSWRMLFANLCDNSWTDTYNFTYTPTQDGTITNKTDYTTRVGINKFVWSAIDATAQRDVDEKIYTNVYFVFTPIGEPNPK